MSEIIPTMRVKVRDERMEKKRWGYGRVGPIIREVVISAICPRCGGPRGKVCGLNQHIDGDWYHLNVWDNKCGHIDWYHNVLVEAGYHAPEDLDLPRTVIFGVVPYGDQEVFHVYKIPQDAFDPEMTEADCTQITTAEVWAQPTNSTDVGRNG